MRSISRNRKKIIHHGFPNRNVERKKIPFQMFLMVECDIYFVPTPHTQRQIIICVFCRSFWSHSISSNFGVPSSRSGPPLFSHKFIAFSTANANEMKRGIGIARFVCAIVCSRNVLTNNRLTISEKKKTNVSLESSDWCEMNVDKRKTHARAGTDTWNTNHIYVITNMDLGQ